MLFPCLGCPPKTEIYDSSSLLPDTSQAILQNVLRQTPPNSTASHTSALFPGGCSAVILEMPRVMGSGTPYTPNSTTSNYCPTPSLPRLVYGKAEDLGH